MCIASEDDKSPVIQIWDLRLASSPLRVLERHDRGVLGVSWCEKDSDLLLSCGRDNRIYCWNPNSNVPGGEVVCEISSNNDGCYSFDVSWCPRNPAVIATSNFDGKVSVYSLLGGQQQIQPAKASAAIADSFPGMEAMQPLSQPVQPASVKSTANQLTIPPKWLRKPCGSSFGFGGKLVTFDFDIANDQNSNPQSQPVAQKKSGVFVSTVVTEPQLLQKSMQLETSLQNENLSEFCDLKISESTCKEDQEVWKFIRANFSTSPNQEFLELLGYDPDKIRQQISAVSGMLPANALSLHGDKSGNAIHSSVDNLAESLGDLDIPLENQPIEKGTENSIFDQIAEQALEDEALRKPFVICTENNGPGMLSKALLTRNLELAVDLCMKQNRFADALILAMQGGAELFQQTQQKYFSKCASEDDCEFPLIEAVVSCDWSGVIERCDAENNWQESLVAALTYCGSNPQQGTQTSPEFEQLCTRIGSRLMELGTLEAKRQAMLCFICAGNLEYVVKCWVETRSSSTTMATEESDIDPLQDLVEVVMLLKKAIYRLGKGNLRGNAADNIGDELSQKMTEYASNLAAQGALQAAITYLGETKDENESPAVTELRERVQGALGIRSSSASGRRAGSKGPASSQTGRVPQTYGFPAQNTPNPPNAGGWTHPGNASAATYQGSYNAPYSSGIHNPVFDDLNAFNPPVPHSESGGITNRRNSRPRNSSVETQQPPSNTFQGQGSFVPPPSFQADTSSASYRGPQTFTPYSSEPNPSQPPVNIFTPDFTKPAAPTPQPTNILRPEPQNNVAGSGVPQPSLGLTPSSSGPGWNDPPPMQATISKPKAGTTTVAAPIQAPITQPLMPMPVQQGAGDSVYGSSGLAPPPMNSSYSLQSGGMNMPPSSMSMPPSSMNMPPPSMNMPPSSMSMPPASNDVYGQNPMMGPVDGYQGSNTPAQQPPPTMFNPIQQGANIMTPQAPVSPPQNNFLNPNQEVNRFNPVPTAPPTQMQGSELHQPNIAPANVPKPKEPIPAEHEILQVVFDGLKTRCLAAASHPVSNIQKSI